MSKSGGKRYQDYVVKDGRFIGEFEQMYRDYEDPWHQTTRQRWASEKVLALNSLERGRNRLGLGKVLEIGCGLGDFTQRIAALGLEATGIDVSMTAVEKGRTRHPGLDLRVGKATDFDLIETLKPDAIVMSEVTWYLLQDLEAILEFLRKRFPQVLVVHTLVTYPTGVQKYGTEHFTDLAGILTCFRMRYLEWGEVCSPDGHKRTYFVGTWSEDVERIWSAND